MVAGRGGVKKDGRKPSALEELFGSASDSEASTFYGFDDAELEDVLFSDSDEDSWLTPDDGNSWVAASLGCKGHFLERKWKIFFFGGANWNYGGSPLKANFTAKISRVILDFLKTFTSVFLWKKRPTKYSFLRWIWRHLFASCFWIFPSIGS